MLDLSPTKLIIVFVVTVILLGPKRLPEVARQLGAGWRKLRALHHQIDQELRQTMPDLPTSQEIARFARSPISLLNQLADRPPRSDAHVGDRTLLLADNGALPRDGAPATTERAGASPLLGAPDGQLADGQLADGQLADGPRVDGPRVDGPREDVARDALFADDPTLN